MKKNTIIIISIFFLILAGILVFALLQRKEKEIKEAKEYFYLLELHFSQGRLSLKNISLKEGHFSEPLWQPEDGWRAEIVSLKGEILYSLKFVPNQVQVFWIPPDEDQTPPGPIYLDNFDFALTLPYFKNAKTINIYDRNGNLQISKDVSYLKPK